MGGAGFVFLVSVLFLGRGDDGDEANDQLAREAFTQRGKVPPEPPVAPGRVGLQEVIGSQGRSVFLLVDARPTAAWAAGHIPGAMDGERLATVAERAAAKRLPVVVYGATAEDPAAAAVADRLRALGIAPVRVCTGGFNDWVARHQQTERGP